MITPFEAFSSATPEDQVSSMSSRVFGQGVFGTRTFFMYHASHADHHVERPSHQNRAQVRNSLDVTSAACLWELFSCCSSCLLASRRLQLPYRQASPSQTRMSSPELQPQVCLNEELCSLPTLVLRVWKSAPEVGLVFRRCQPTHQLFLQSCC